MRVYIVALIIVSILIFVLINYYIGKTGWKYYASKVTLINIKLYWLTFILLSMTYILPFIPLNYLPKSVINLISKIGAYWLSIILYSFIFFLLADVLSLLIKKRNRRHYLFRKEIINSEILHNAASIIIIFIIFYGIYRAYYPVVTHYEVDIAKKPKNMTNLHVLLLSDIHIGNIIGKDNLVRMVKEVNSLKPDIIILCGDIINTSSKDFIIQDADEILRGFKSKYGVYAVPGNHDYYDKNDIENKFKCYKSSNITVLKDSYVEIDGSVYIVGRDDAESKMVTNKERKSVTDLTYGLNHSLPIIVLDHQPIDIENEEKNDVDLQLSGHTHGGQTLISSLWSKRVYHELLYGRFHENNFNLIITSGFGTWGIPMRTGTRAEIADIDIKFTH